VRPGHGSRGQDLLNPVNDELHYHGRVGQYAAHGNVSHFLLPHSRSEDRVFHGIHLVDGTVFGFKT
jgi:hypothetical protein